MDDYRSFIQRMGLIGTANFLVTIMPLIILPILTQNLGIQEYGIWVQFTITITLIPAIAILGLPYTMVRFLAAATSKEEIQEGFYSIAFTIIIGSFIISLILLLASGILARSLFNGNFTVALILPPTVFFTALTLLFLDYFRTFQQMGKYALVIVSQAYITVVIVFILVFSGYGIVGAIIGILITQILMALVLYLIVFRQIGFKFPKFRNIREYLFFGLPTIPSNLAFWILDASDRYIIGFLIGISFVGYYSAGYTIGSLMSLLLSPFYTVLLPLLSQYYAERRIRDTRFLLNYSIKFFLIIAVPFVFLLSLLSKPALMILTTPNIASIGFIVTPIIAAGGLIFGLYTIITQIIVLERKTQITGNIWIISTVLNIIMDVTFGYYFGIIGIAMTTLIIYTFAFIITLHYSLKYIRCTFYFGFIAKTIGAAFIMSIIVLLLNPSGPLYVLLTFVFGIVFYMIVLWLLGGIRKGEIIFLADVFKDLLKTAYASIRRLA